MIKSAQTALHFELQMTTLIAALSFFTPGGSGSNAYTEGKCGQDEFYGWAQYAENEAAKRRPDLDMSTFQRRILILPDM